MTDIPSAAQICARYRNPDLAAEQAWKVGQEGKDRQQVFRDAGRVGLAVHHWIYARLRGDCPPVDEALRGYLSSFGAWYKEHKIDGEEFTEIGEDLDATHYLARVDFAIKGVGRAAEVVDFTTAEVIDPSYFLPLLAGTMWAYEQVYHMESHLMSGTILQLSSKGDYPNVWRMTTEYRRVRGTFQIMQSLYNSLEELSGFGIEMKVTL